MATAIMLRIVCHDLQRKGLLLLGAKPSAASQMDRRWEQTHFRDMVDGQESDNGGSIVYQGKLDELGERL
jgi:hypothetical protein